MLMLELDHQPWYFSALQGQIQVLGLYWTDVQCTKINLDWKGSKFCINFDFQEKYNF